MEPFTAVATNIAAGPEPTAPRSLTSRERFLAALSNPEPDRIPIDLSGHPVQQSAIVEEDVLHLEL